LRLLLNRDKDGVDSLPPLSRVLNDLLKWLTVSCLTPPVSFSIDSMLLLPKHYEQLIERLPFILERVNSTFYQNQEFERICRDFDAENGCYLPYTSFLLKPAFHLSFYAKIIQSILSSVSLSNLSHFNHLFLFLELIDC